MGSWLNYHQEVSENKSDKQQGGESIGSIFFKLEEFFLPQNVTVIEKLTGTGTLLRTCPRPRPAPHPKLLTAPILQCPYKVVLQIRYQSPTMHACHPRAPTESYITADVKREPRRHSQLLSFSHILNGFQVRSLIIS